MGHPGVNVTSGWVESANLFEDALLLLFGDALFPAEGEHVDEHGNSVTIAL